MLVTAVPGSGVQIVRQQLTRNTASFGRDQETVDDHAFFGETQDNAVSAQFSHVQLWNDAADGNTIYLDGIVLMSAVADLIHIRSSVAALTTGGGAKGAMKLAATTADGEIRTMTNAAKQGVGIARVDIEADIAYALWPRNPWVLDEDRGLIVCPATVNQNMRCMFFWREFSNT